VIHNDDPSFPRKHLRTSLKFKRLASYSACPEIIPQVHKRKSFSWNPIDVLRILAYIILVTRHIIIYIR
jgi:hypothetical protein